MKTIRGTLWGTKDRIEVQVDDKDVNQHGFPMPVITDIKTGQKYTVTPKACSIPKCKCENWLRLHKNDK